MNPRLVPFQNYRVLLLDISRRSETGLYVPLPFVEDGERLYVRTFERTSRAMRLNHHVRVAPANALEQIEGDWQDGIARLLSGSEAQTAYDRLDHQYGLRGSDYYYRHARGEIMVIAIDL